MVNIDFKDNYPFKCPEIKFMTKIYHPNVKTDSGEICKAALENDWVPTRNADYIINGLITMLTDPDDSAPLEDDICNVFKSDRKKFDATAAEWTAKYAK